MVAIALKPKTLTLSHLGLSRGSSSSHSHSTTPLATPPALSPAASTHDVDPFAAHAQAHPDKGRSFLGAALRRSTSFRSASPSPVLASTPIVADAATAPTSRSSSANSHKPRSGGPKPRSLSSGPSGHAPTANGPGGSALAMTQSASLPPLSRRQVAGVTPGPAPTAAAHAHGAPSNPATQLEENYVGRVSLRLSEAVNRVFLGDSHAAVVDVVGSTKARPTPSAVKAKELGDLLFSELQSALPDTYLLRILLRSPIVKSLSLFLSRLSALLLAPSTTPFVPSAPPTPQASTFSLSIASTPAAGKQPAQKGAAGPAGCTAPPSVVYNLTLVRCALALKAGLTRARSLGVSPIGETLRPWEDKLDELVGRVMGPLVLGIKEGVRSTCLSARALELPGPAGGATTGARTLSAIGRAPVPVSASAPTWLRDLTSTLNGTGALISKIDGEDGKDRARWLVAVGTCAVWKGMLGLAARPLHPSSTTAAEAPAKPVATKALFTKSAKRSPSPSRTSPPLGPAPLPAPDVLDEPFIRLLAQLEALERSLVAFSTFLPPAPREPATLDVTLCKGECGLCKTGRKFDPESEDDDEEAKSIDQAGGLAHYAMREAMQALSAMIVVVRSTGSADGRKKLAAALGTTHSPVVAPQREDEEIKPLTPSDLLSALDKSVPAKSESSASLSSAMSSSTTSTKPAICETLSAALDTLPPLLLLHVLVSRLPPSLGFQLPHQLWGLEWEAYERELKGFRAAEEWVGEIGWEVAGEVGRVEEGLDGRREDLGLLKRAVRRVGVEV
ncbi:hypothetical protein MNV49_003791 [Pseudohyphozyma bogoriensis]|nr:hypothetical protein MNV49_003791 [Pseudohyphozyma bogoriensis]